MLRIWVINKFIPILSFLDLLIKINLSNQKNKMTPEVQSEFLEQLASASQSLQILHFSKGRHKGHKHKIFLTIIDNFFVPFIVCLLEIAESQQNLTYLPISWLG